MKEKDMIRMFPDATRRSRRKKPVIDCTPDHPLTTAKMVVAAMIGLPVGILLMILIAYLGQKFGF